MRLLLNDNWVTIPSDLSEITLGQRIDFQLEHGNLLHEMYKSIIEMEDELEKELELGQWHFEKIYRTMAFFLNATLEAVKESEHIEKIFGLYTTSMDLVFQQEQEEYDYPQLEFIWNDEEWVIEAPELKNGHKMMFGEFIDAKQIVQDMVGLSKSKWECMLPLCAIFLRRRGEAYQESFVHEGSERLALMRELPLNIALQVGFFLSCSLDIYRTTFLSSLTAGLKVA